MEKTFTCKYGTVVSSGSLNTTALLEGCRKAVLIDDARKRKEEEDAA